VGAYEEVRNDVIREHKDALARVQAAPSQEGLSGAVSIPAVTVSGSQPAWLGSVWRQVLTVAALVGAAAGLVMTWIVGSTSAVAAGFGGTFAIVSMLVAYFTVAGFSAASFSIGTGTDTPAAEGNGSSGGTA
jgi:hypothetical protein